MNVPQLRFKGFEGEWKEKKIKDIAVVTSGATPSRSNLSYFTNGSIPWIKTLDLNNSIINKAQEFVTQKAMEETSLRFLPPNTLLIAMYGGFNQIGRTGLTNFSATTNQAISALTPYEKSFDPFFLQSYLNFNVMKWKRLAASSRKDPNITKKDIEHFLVKLPSFNEQIKLAKFLRLIDIKIRKQKEKIKKLEQFKKGMMQKIFSQDLRFKDEDGGEFPEWEENEIGYLGNTYTGLSGKTKEDFGRGEASFITYVNVFNNLKASINGLQRVDLSDGKNQNAVMQGDILFTTSSETPHEVGMASYWGFEQGNIYLNSFCFGFRLTNNFVDGEFLTYLLRSPLYRREITLLAQGSTRYNISKTGLMKMKVLLPILEEQKKIKKVLSDIDLKLVKEKEKLMILHEQKKGFMQKIFV